MKLTLFIIASTLLFATPSIEKEALTITLHNLKTEEGNIRVGIYKVTNDFPNEDDTYARKIYIINRTGSIKMSIKDLEYGQYAIAVYQDINKNDRLDTNLFGAPKEPFAFSNNVKPRFSAPDFNDCKITYSKNQHNFVINLLNY